MTIQKLFVENGTVNEQYTSEPRMDIVLAIMRELHYQSDKLKHFKDHQFIKAATEEISVFNSFVNGFTIYTVLTDFSTTTLSINWNVGQFVGTIEDRETKQVVLQVASN